MGHNGRSGVQCLSGSPFGIHRHGWRSDRWSGERPTVEPDSLRDGFREERFIENRYGRNRFVVGNDHPTREISVDGFWMDANEVSNAKYRQFVFWVRDSIIRERLADPAYAGDETYKIEEGQVRESCDSLSELEKADTLETPERRRVEGDRKRVRDESGYGGADVGCAPDELPL